MGNESDKLNDGLAKRSHPNDQISSGMSIRGGQQERQVLSSDDQTRPDRQRPNYHTVPIRSELPKIPKSYADEPVKDLPSDSFWLDVVQRTNANDVPNEWPGAQTHTTSTAQYKLLYSKANGPCKCFRSLEIKLLTQRRFFPQIIQV